MPWQHGELHCIGQACKPHSDSSERHVHRMSYEYHRFECEFCSDAVVHNHSCQCANAFEQLCSMP